MSFKQRIYLIIFLTMVAVIILAGINYWLIMRTNIIVGQIQEKRQTLSFRSRVVEGETLLRSDLIRAQREGAFLENVLPASDNLIDFPRDIAVWANQNNIDVGFSFLREVESKNGEPGHIPFLLTGAGQRQDIFNFIRAIENSRYFIQFNEYDLVSESDKYTLFINGQIFSR
ncbi:MAG: hypothetical protein AAB847_01910 [Patescibacteria group bacterium]